MLPVEFSNIALALMGALDTQVSSKVASVIKRGAWAELPKIKVDPSHYTCPENYFRDAQAVAFLKKNGDLPAIADLESAAEKGFYELERQNKITNMRISRFLEEGDLSPSEVRIAEFFDDVQRDIARLLGALPRDLNGRFGNGATFDENAREASLLHKVHHRPSVTPSSVCLQDLWCRTAWYRGLASDHPELSQPKVVRGNKFFTVSKDMTKRRPCCKEPSMNVFYQLGAAKHLRRALLKWGVDLDKSQDIHRLAAMRGSVDQSVATIDLSNASDTIARKLIHLFLRKTPLWLDLLESLRSPMTLIRGKWVHLEKFSSMGNGFTFELETIVFLAITRAVARQHGLDPDTETADRRLLQFGDDAIVPTAIARDVLKAFTFCGFTANEDKTFIEGPFRESCGGDFFNGVAVRPHYTKEFPNGPHDFIKLANGIRRVGRQDPHACLRWDRLKRVWLRVLDNLPSRVRRCRGPETLGDIVIHDDFDKFREHDGYRIRCCIREVETFQPQFREPRLRGSPGPIMAYALYGGSSTLSPGRGEPPIGYRIKWVPIC